MKILFLTSNAFLPEAFFGGKQYSIHALCNELKKRGVIPSVFCSLSSNKMSRFRIKQSLRKLLFKRTDPVGDNSLGYTVYRAWNPESHIEYILARIQPDFVVVFSGNIGRLIKKITPQTDVPIGISWASLSNLSSIQSLDDNILHISNSDFIASAVDKKFGGKIITIPPLIERERYSNPRPSNGKFVTFINPIEFKGVEKAMEIAGLCEDIPFLFQEGWQIKKDDLYHLKQQLLLLPNVTFTRQTRHIEKVYKQTRILIAPNKGEEAWGRVITEAQCSGIPVLASNVGGLPESVGNGGMLFDVDSTANEWAAKIKELYHSDSLYQEWSKKAYDNAHGWKLSSDFLAEKLLSFILNNVKQ